MGRGATRGGEAAGKKLKAQSSKLKGMAKLHADAAPAGNDFAKRLARVEPRNLGRSADLQIGALPTPVHAEL